MNPSKRDSGGSESKRRPCGIGSREWTDDFEMEEVAMSQEMLAATRRWKRQEDELSPEA